MFLRIGTIVSLLLPTVVNAQVDSTKTAAEPQNLYEVSANLDYVDVDQLGDSVFAYGATVGRNLTESVAVEATIDYWSESSGVLANQAVTISDFAIGIGGRYEFEEAYPKVRPFVAGGLALHRFEAQFSEVRDGDSSEVIDKYEDVSSDVEGVLGTDVSAGAFYMIDENLDASARVKLRNMLDESVNLDQLALGVGLRYGL